MPAAEPTPTAFGDDLNPRMRALADLMIPAMREESGRHEYDGVIADLSTTGVSRGLAALGGPPLGDPHEDAHLAAFEHAARVEYGEIAAHRSNPLVHLANLDLGCYDRQYAPEPDRAAARRAHLASWPDAIDAAIDALDSVPAPVAEATMDAVAGLAADVADSDGDLGTAALAAHARLLAHLRTAAESGPPDAALGAAALTHLLSAAEAMPVDLTEMARRGEDETARLRALLADGCARFDAATPPAEMIATLLADHPRGDEVIEAARTLTAEVVEWTRRTGLAPYHDGVCEVGPSRPSRQWAMAMMTWAAPGEPDTPSEYQITPPSPHWPESAQQEWLQVFSATTLPAITVHEVAPGHFSHGIALRHAKSPVRRTFYSGAFVEGWAHYAEEMALQQGFHHGDPRYGIGMCIEALVRVTRLVCAIGLHTGAMNVADATARFSSDAYLAGPAAASEARRGTFDPTYGRYTLGKLLITDLAAQARTQWGGSFSLPRLHAALLDLGAPPLGLMSTALVDG